jgi:hypothetical protein
MLAKSVNLVFRGKSYPVPCANLPGQRWSAAEIPVTSDVSQDSFNGFLDFCLRRGATLTPDTALEILELCEELHADHWALQITRWITANGDALLVKRIARAYRKGDSAYADLCAALRPRLEAHLLSPDLAALPVRVLTELFSGAPAHSPAYFAFFMSALRRTGPAASLLFRGADFARLSAGQLLALLDSPDFVWACVTDEVGRAQESARAEIRTVCRDLRERA